MTAKLTDDAVSRLELHDGRVELLDEILATPALDGYDGAAPRRRRLPTAFTVGIAAAAVLVAAVGVPIWVAQRSDDGTTQVPVQVQPPAGDLAVLDASGWEADHVSLSENEGEVSYTRGDQSLDVHWRPAKFYADYVEDRQHIDHPEKNEGERVALLGRDARLWAYGPRDHTVISEVQGDYFLEVRGSGMAKPDFLGLLEQLRVVDEAGFESSLPDEFVVGEERAAEVREILAAMGTELPPGYDGAPLTSNEPDPYHLGADLAGGMACAWLDEFATAKRSGDEARMEAAVAALQESKAWPILREMDERGDYPEVVWDYADQAKDGRVPEGYREGLGCTG
jgi:hypothetical protein